MAASMATAQTGLRHSSAIVVGLFGCSSSIPRLARIGSPRLARIKAAYAQQIALKILCCIRLLLLCCSGVRSLASICSMLKPL